MIRFLNIVLAALLAGTSFGIWMGLDPTRFSAHTYAEVQQQTILKLNALMISMVVMATLLTLISAFIQRRNKSASQTLLWAAALLIGCMLISRFGNGPINEQILGWNINEIPSNWMELRDHWWLFHVVRTICELIALGLIVWTEMKPRYLGRFS